MPRKPLVLTLALLLLLLPAAAALSCSEREASAGTPSLLAMQPLPVFSGSNATLSSCIEFGGNTVVSEAEYAGAATGSEPASSLRVFLRNRLLIEGTHVELVDILPTLLSSLDVLVPDSVDGRLVWADRVVG